VSFTWRLLRAGREVGRVELADDGKVLAQWPADVPMDVRRAIEEGRESCWPHLYSYEPRPWLARSPEYWHTVLSVRASPAGRWDQVETNYKPPDYPTYDEQGNPIVY